MKARVHISFKTGVLDPQGKAIANALGALGFAGGAVLAFALTGAIPQGHLGRVEAPVFPAFSAWQVLHLAGLAAAILLSSAISQVADGELVWPVDGLSTTAIYMLAVAGQLMLRGRRAA